ncbi:MAG: hypothetical protein IKY45_03420 [Clostridia bacterium]|nr:hypothetical protein [Clostridia bacterium]
MIIFKVLGLLAVFSVPSVFGLYKSFSLKKRSIKLKSLVMSLAKLSEYIRIEKTEKTGLFKRCFDASLINTDLSFNSEYLLKEDITLLNEFLNDFGLCDRKGEYERTCTYIKLFGRLLEKAECENEKLCKLYSLLGVLTGLSLCIFLI